MHIFVCVRNELKKSIKEFNEIVRSFKIAKIYSSNYMGVGVKNFVLSGPEKELSIAVSLSQMIRIQRRGLHMCGYNLLDRACL